MLRPLFALLLAASAAVAAPVPKDAGIPENVRRAWKDRGATVEWYGKTVGGQNWDGRSMPDRWRAESDPELVLDPIPVACFDRPTESLKGLPPLGPRYAVEFVNCLPDGWADDLPAPECVAVVGIHRAGGELPEVDLAALKRFPRLTRVELTGLRLTAEQMAPLKALAKMESLKFYNTAIESAGYAVLAELPFLNDLDLGDTGRLVTAEVLGHLAKCKGLRRLDMSGNRAADDALAPLATMTQLRSLTLRDARNFTDAGIAHLAGLTELRELDLGAIGNGNPPLGDATVAVVAKMTKLERLGLREATFTAPAFATLAALTELRHLDLTSTPADDDTMAVVATFAKLETLDMQDTPVTARGLGRLAPLAGLRVVRLSRNKYDDAALAALSGFKNLRELEMDESKVTDAGLAHLAGLADLRALGLGRTRVTVEGLRHVAGLRGLRTLDLPTAASTDAGLERLKGLTELRGLQVSGDGVTDAGVAHLKGMTKLRCLFLGGTAVTDAGLQALKTSPELRWLLLDYAGATEDGFAALAALPRLKRLDINGIPFGEKGIAALAKLPELRYLRAEVRAGTPREAALKAALPRCATH